MTVSLKSLRVTADMDGRGYVQGAKAVEQSSEAAAQAVAGLGTAVKQTDTKVGTSGNALERLNKRFIDGYASAAQFEKAVAKVGRVLETGQTDMAHAERLLVGISQKYQQTANAADYMAAGQHDLAAAITSANRTIETSSNVIDFNTAVKNRNAAATSQMTMRNRQLMFQMVDVGQALATAPTMGIYALQNLGFQFAQIGQMYYGQGGLKAAFTDSAAMAGRFAAKLGPLALGVGVVAAAFAGMQHEIRESTGVAVSFGDVALASVQVAANAIYEFFEPAIAALAPWFSSAWDTIVGGFKWLNNWLIRLWTGAAATIKFGVQTLPPAFIVAAEAAANGFVKAINWMVEKSIAGFNAIIDAASWVSEKLGQGPIEGRFDPSAYLVTPFDFGGASALSEVRRQAAAYNEEMKAIADRDYLGRYFDAVSEQAVANYSKRMDEAAKKTKAGLSEAEKALQKFLRTADQLVEKHLPAQAAAAEAEYLIRMLDEMGDALTDVQRKAVEMEIDDLFRKAAGEAGEAAKAIEQTLGTVLSDLFSGPLDDADAFFDKVLSGFAQLGQANLQKFFDGALTGGRTGANDNFAPTHSIADVLGHAVQKGAASGTETGASKGLQVIGDLFSGGGSNPLSGRVGQLASAGLGGIGIGYETQSPVMGGLGGAVSGFMAAGPIGAVVGGIFGVLGGIFGASRKAREEQEKARQEIAENRGAIENFLASGLGTGLGVAQAAERKYLDQGREYRAAADKAGDQQLVNDIDRAMRQMSSLLRNDFTQAFEGTIASLEAGLGSSSPFTQAQSAIVGLREELLNFIADTQWAGANVDRARVATQDYALSLLQAEPELSQVEQSLLRISGTAAGLGNTLLQLGMSATSAASAIRSGLTSALAELRSEFQGDLARSINDLAGNGYINEIADAQERYNERLRDAASLGLDAQQASAEYALALADIATRSGLSSTHLRELAVQFGATTSIVDDAQAALGSFRNLSTQVRSFLESVSLNSALSTLSAQDRLSEARRQFDDVVLRARQGDPSAQDRVESTARAYLEQASDFFASTEQYAAAFAYVQSTLLDLGAAAESEADRLRQIRELAQQQVTLLSRQNSATAGVEASVNSLAASIASQAGVTHGHLAQIAANTAAPPVVQVVQQVTQNFENHYAGGEGSPVANSWGGTVYSDPGFSQNASWAAANGGFPSAPSGGGYESGIGLYADGGYTGDIGRNQIAGLVHGQEFVMNAEATRRWRPMFEAMNAGTYAGGGNDRDNFRELGRMLAGSINAQTEVLRSELSAMREELKQLKNETRIAAQQKPRLTANGRG
ncbi:MAG: hypothetical protein Rhirs2KO_18490 [Rhizobiaceae bacterium]